MAKKRVIYGTRKGKRHLIDCIDGPFTHGKIDMGTGQLDTLTFSVNGCKPGHYERRMYSTSAVWKEEATRGQKL